MTTRSARPSSVRATTTLPSRMTSRCAYAAQGRLDPVGDRLLVAAHRLDVDQVAQQRDQVAVQVQTVRHAGTLPGRRSAARCRLRLAGRLGPRDRDRHDRDRTAWGWGLATVHDSGRRAGHLLPGPGPRQSDRGRRAGRAGRRPAQRRDASRRADRGWCVRRSTWTPRRPTPPDAYLRLHLLSHRLVAPRTINLDGIFGVLPNVVWTSMGPCAVDGFEAVRSRLRAAARVGDRVRGGQVPADGRLRAAHRASGSPMPTGSGWAPTWPPAPP